MLICDAQVHIWAANTPERPWPARHAPHRPVPLGKEELLAEMDKAGIDRVVIVPPSWEGDRNDVAIDAATSHPQRFAIMGRFDPDVPATQSQQVASQLGARFVEFADEGHVPTVNGQSCPQAVLHSFLDDPSSPPDSCAATTGPPHWLVDP